MSRVRSATVKGFAARASGYCRRLWGLLLRRSGRRHHRHPGSLLRRHAAEAQRAQGAAASNSRRRGGTRLRPAHISRLDRGSRNRDRVVGGRADRRAPRPARERPRLARGNHRLRSRRRYLALRPLTRAGASEARAETA